MDDAGRRVPVFVRSTRALVGTVIAPITSPGPTTETIEVEGIKATYIRRFEIQVLMVIFDDLDQASRWPSFEPLGREAKP